MRYNCKIIKYTLQKLKYFVHIDKNSDFKKKYENYQILSMYLILLPKSYKLYS